MKQLSHYDVVSEIEGEDRILVRYIRHKKDGPDSDEHRKVIRKLVRKLAPKELFPSIRIVPSFKKG
jgi:hypothetical protein